MRSIAIVLACLACGGQSENSTAASYSNNLFHVESGSCRVVDGGTCYQSTNYPSSYLNKDHCRATTTRDELISAVRFDTESCCDHLHIGSQRYDGNTGPYDVYVTHNTQIEWDTDASYTDGGWKICARTITTTTKIHMDVQTILLSLIYIMLSVSLVAQLWTIFVEHTWCCGGNGGFPAILLSLVDPTQDSENIWGRTPAASKISALACPGWAVATLILWIGMPWEYYRGCEMIICRAIALSCVIHQIWWWRACFGKVDVNDIYQRDASVYLVRTSIPDFILGGSAAYVGFLSGPWSDEGFIGFDIMDWVRLVILFFLVVCACFACVYSAFYSVPTTHLQHPHGPNDPPPATLWNMTPAGSKICAIRASAWTMSFFATGICVVWTMNPFLIILFYQCMSVAYVWFQFLYYFGMLGHTDDALFRGHLGTYASSHVRGWNDFFKWQTFPGDVIFFIMFTVLGWLQF